MDPFTDPDAEVRVLVHHDGQHCLWHTFYPVPHGWSTELCPTPRSEALAYLKSRLNESTSEAARP